VISQQQLPALVNSAAEQSADDASALVIGLDGV